MHAVSEGSATTCWTAFQFLQEWFHFGDDFFNPRFLRYICSAGFQVHYALTINQQIVEDIVRHFMTDRLINRNTKTITFSLPPDMAEQVQDVMRDEGRTMSELIREALRNYMEEREWLRTIRYERLRTRHAEQEDSQGD